MHDLLFLFMKMFHHLIVVFFIPYLYFVQCIVLTTILSKVHLLTFAELTPSTDEDNELWLKALKATLISIIGISDSGRSK